MREVIRKIVWDMETLEVVSRVTEPYDGPWGLCKESDAEKAAQQQQQEFSTSLLSTYKALGTEATSILSVIEPQLTAMATNPEGFGTTEYAALQAEIINSTGTQYSNAAKAAATEFATSNEAGLPSGVEEVVQGNIKAAAAGQVAGESTNLAVANEQLKQQQQQYALSTLGGLSTTLSGQSIGAASAGSSSTAQQFNEASTVYNQGSLWKNILGGVVGSLAQTGLGMLTGGLASVAGGGSFGAGASAAGGGPH